MGTISTTAALRVAIDIRRNADSVSISTIVHYRSLSLTIAAQRSRSGNRPGQVYFWPIGVASATPTLQII